LSVQPDDLVSQFIDFLRSFKNSESLSPQLRVAISVRTNLHAILLDVCAEGRTILLTGSAGSGKTHLLHAIISELEPKARILRVPDKVSKPYVLVVEDATELSTSERIAFIRPGDRQCVCKIMAINEGPLREAAKARGGHEVVA
jgi:serine kinase of HPr protein (carbohydrate metabolism regulator)